MELILKGLGYRGEPRLESEVKPATEEAAPQPTEHQQSAPETAPAAETTPAVEEPAQMAAPEPTFEPSVETASEPSDAPAEAAAAAEGIAVAAQAPEEEGPKSILVWRPSGRQQRHQKPGGHRSAGKSDGPTRNRKFAGKNRKGVPGGGQKGAGKQQNFSSKAAKPVKLDPDSPFAKLAALKENLSKGE
jgi:ATP-dependent RNA helicase SUPV3L1/SUV3